MPPPQLLSKQRGRTGRFAAGLRIATHNIRGFRGAGAVGGAAPALNKVHSLYREWHALRLHIVLVQEVMIEAADGRAKMDVEVALDQAARAARGHSYQVFWGCYHMQQSTIGGAAPVGATGVTGRGRSKWGVAILIRKDLLAGAPGVIKIDSVRDVKADKDGRLMHLKVAWGGHTMHCINAYLPSGKPPAQKSFVEQRLSPLIKGTSHPVVLGGDFNFTPDWRMDRAVVLAARNGGAAPSSHRNDERPARALEALVKAAELEDAFRSRHPRLGGFTYHCTTAMSRLDRIYLSSALMPRLVQCTARGPSVSDHIPVVVHLTPRTPLNRGTPPRRYRLLFSSSKDQVEELQTWFAEEAEEALRRRGLEGHDLIAWWVGFKQRVVGKVQQLNAQHKGAAQQRTAEMAAAGQAVRAAMDGVGQTKGPTSPDALRAIIEARHRFVAASAAVALAERLHRRRCNIAKGERPTPHLTRLISRPEAAREVGALRTAAGGVVREGSKLARMMAEYFAAISAEHAGDGSAVDQVLGAVRQHATPLDAETAAAAGQAVVEVEEVAAALKRMQPGTAPGLDGLPPEVWRRGGAGATELLAALFTAIGSTGTTPPGFLEGSISPIHKAGDAMLMSNYRPICLLNTDYRLMAKVLATRLGPVLAAAVGAEQAAFLPGRTITSTVTFLQLLPPALRSGDKSAAVAFLDFRKAYDTVSREFLFRVMGEVGAGEGLVRWARLMLTDTTTAAVVNGYVSKQLRYDEGVRQGCPLAPLLYLFAAWALTCWLKECPAVGVEVVPGHMVHAAQFADDIEVLLRDLEVSTMQQFLDHMAVFQRASGQALNPQKSLLLPVGQVEPGAQLPDQVRGVKVVDRAKTLGLIFSNGREDIPEVDWEERLAPVRNRYSKIATLHLSIFGRAQCASAYGLGGLHYHLQHSSMPQEVGEEVHKITVALVDRSLGPDAHERRLPGVHSDLLVGRPACGGFSLLPIDQHVRARHAVLARHLVVWLAGEPRALLRADATEAEVPAPPRPPWVALASHLLTNLCPAAHPALCLVTAAAVKTEDDCLPGQEVRRPLPAGPLQRMLQGLQALGPPHLVGDEPLLQPGGAEVWRMPLWGNPLLQLEYREDQRTVQWEMQGYGGVPLATRQIWEKEQVCGFRSWVGTPGLHTVGDLRRLTVRLTAVKIKWQGFARQGRPCRLMWDSPGDQMDGGGYSRQVLTEVWGVDTVVLPTAVRQWVRDWAPWRGDQDEGMELWHVAQAMYAALPEEWRRAATLCRGPTPAGVGQGMLDPGQVQLPLDQAQPMVEGVVARLGWGNFLLAGMQRGKESGGPWHLSVKAATRRQLRPLFDQQAEARGVYVLDALVAVGAPSPGDKAVQRARRGLDMGMRELWKIRWERRWLEALWRLAVNGVPGAGGHDIDQNGPCPCGWEGPVLEGVELRCREWRHHHFWGCPVAKAVVEQVQRGLPQLPQQQPQPALRRDQVWVLRAPAGVQACVWRVVCVAVLDAMWHGRRLLWAMELSRRDQPAVDPTQRLITEFMPVVGGGTAVAPPTVSECAAARAAARFWDVLASLVALGHVPNSPKWQEVEADHPFIGVQVKPSPQDPARKRLVLNAPEDQA